MRYMLIIALLTLSGCGQKGDLFLPTESSDAAPETAAPAAQPTTPSQ